MFIVTHESAQDEPAYQGDFFCCLAYMRKVKEPDRILCFEQSSGLLYAYRGSAPRGLLAEAEKAVLAELKLLPEYGKSTKMRLPREATGGE